VVPPAGGGIDERCVRRDREGAQSQVKVGGVGPRIPIISENGRTESSAPRKGVGGTREKNQVKQESVPMGLTRVRKEGLKSDLTTN